MNLGHELLTKVHKFVLFFHHLQCRFYVEDKELGGGGGVGRGDKDEC